MSSTSPATVGAQQTVASVLNRYKPVVAKLLQGTGLSEETFIAQIANACRATPKLWECEPETVLGAALRCAQLGLTPNDGTNLAWIIPYGRVAAFQLGYGGVMQLARWSQPGLIFEGRPVYPNDTFDPGYSEGSTFRHRSHLAKKLPRGGDPVAWYVIATYPDGRRLTQVLDREGVEYHRRFSKQPDGEMWTKSYDAAALKSCVLEMKRWLPATRRLQEALAAEDKGVHDVRDMEPIDAQPELEAAPDTGTEEP